MMNEEPEKKQPSQKTGGFDARQKIQDLWDGKIPLVQVFWIYYFIIVVVLQALTGMLAPLAPIFTILKLVWAGFMIKPILIAADQYKGPSHWALLAKVAAVLIAIALIGDVLRVLF